MSLKSKAMGAALNAYLSSRPAKRALYDMGRILRGGKRRARLYYRADDPYSHLLAQVAPRLQRAYGIEVQIVPVAKPDVSVNPEPQMLLAHAICDAAILAQHFGLAFPTDAQPPPDDRVRRAHAVLLEPRAAAQQAEVAIELGEAVWRDDGEALASLVECYGGISGQTVRPALEANYAALERAGHYQPGVLHYGGEWYWSADRLCHLETRLKGEGLEGSLDLSSRASPYLASSIGPAAAPLRMDLFFSFRSPYSYLAIPQLLALRDRHGVDIRVKPVLPMVMRGLEVPRAKRLYIVNDAKREAERLGIPFGRICDPLGRGIGYCMAVFFGCVQGTSNELEFVHSVARGIWAEARDVSHLPDLIALAGRAGVGEVDVRAAVEDPGWKERVKANRESLSELGLWGVPSLRIGGYATWGQDRIPLLDAEIARFSRAD